MKYDRTTRLSAYQHQCESNDEHADERSEPSAHPVSQWPEEVRADEVRDGGREECGTQLPLGGVHLVHHEDGEGRLQHRDAHVGEGNGSYIRIEKETVYSIVLGIHKLL